MRKYFLPFLIVFIIAAPAFASLINGQYFTMHDDQHIARLYLLDQAIHQGYLYPRWVDLLGFGYGYPLFNFYPPLVYYVAELFHLLGFSLIWSIKLTFIAGFIFAGWGTYLFSKKYLGSIIAYVPAAVYTFFFYHAVNVYVRGALAEFFSMAIIPFIFLTIKNLVDNTNLKNALLFGVVLALLILNHPLIAFPSLFFIGIFFLCHFFIDKKNSLRLLKFFTLGGITGLLLSAFFWLPSIVEKKYTYVDEILTHELANYKIHFVYLQQFWYSLWGYGGSIAGPSDGLTFQLGKVPLFLCLTAIVLALINLGYKKSKIQYMQFGVFLFLALFSLFMTTQLSSIIWDHISYLWYMQFPWRFLTFAGFFIAIVAGYSIFFAEEILKTKIRLPKALISIVCGLVIVSTIFIYGKYFKPQNLRYVTDQDLTTYEDIAWRISKTSFEFVPKGIKTAKTPLNTTTLDIKKSDLPSKPFSVKNGQGLVQMLGNNFNRKSLYVNATTPIKLQLNTYDFPGWTAVLKDTTMNRQRLLTINSNNDLRLITVDIPKGTYEVLFEFRNTQVRAIADAVSLLSFITVITYFLVLRKILSLKKVG